MSPNSSRVTPSAKRLLMGTAPVAIALALSLVLRMLSTVLGTRLSNVSEFGEFATVNAIGVFVGTLAMGGWPSYLLATVPKYGISRQAARDMQKRLALTCFAFVLAQSILILSALRDHSTVATLLFAGVLVTGTTFATVFNEAQRASGNVVRSRFAIAIVPPSVTSISLVACYGIGIAVSSEVLLLANALGWLVLWVLASVSLRRHYVDQVTLDPGVSRRDLMLTKVSQAGLATADVFVVGWLLGAQQGALYAIASRVATTAGIGYTAVVMAYGPLVSRLAGQPVELRKLTKRMTWLGIAVTVPIVIGASVFRTQLLHLFGPEYVDAQVLMLVLLAGVATNAICGPIGLIVNVTGQEAVGRRTLVTAGVVFFVLLPIVALSFGALGAAVLWTSITLLWNLALWAQVDLANGAVSRTSHAGD